MQNAVGVCFLSTKNYDNLISPFHPSRKHIELDFLPEKADSTVSQNEIYEGVRQLFALLCLDKSNFSSATWNPLSDLIKPGHTVVIKPNFIRHINENPNGTMASVITHGCVIRPIIDYCLKALDFRGRVVIADAPQHDCNIEQVKKYSGIEKLQNFYAQYLNFNLEFIDLRQEFVNFTDGIITGRTKLAGDQLGYSIVDLGADSELHKVETHCKLLRGADYDEEETIIHHSNGEHEYLISNTVLNADLIINVPKIKTHKKAGVTLALKNMVGINGNKNWLPHHRMGFPEEQGDEFPTKSLRNRIRRFGVEKARYFLKRGKFQHFLRFIRSAEDFVDAAPTIRSGNWYGNDTIWRTIIDLNKCLFFSDKCGKLQDEIYAARKYLVIFDGIVAGEGNGPMAPEDKPLGVICGGFDPVLVDLAVVKLMGFDWNKIPKIYNSTKLSKYRYTTFTNYEDIQIELFDQNSNEHCRKMLSGIDWTFRFQPHVGWKGYIEHK